MAKSIEGGCHCGTIRYALSAPPQASMICHCRSCQRITGAPVVAWLTVTADALAITKGEPARYASSPKIDRRFCAACGTHIAYTIAGDGLRRSRHRHARRSRRVPADAPFLA